MQRLGIFVYPLSEVGEGFPDISGFFYVNVIHDMQTHSLEVALK